jgi:hypothetical protein
MFEVGNAHHPGFHDAPVPSIKIESKGDDNALALRTIVSVDIVKLMLWLRILSVV